MNSRRRIASPKVRDKSSYRATPIRAHKITIKRQAMSALGHKRTYAVQKDMSALPPLATAKADFAIRYVRFTPESGHVRCKNSCPLCAKSGHGDLRRPTKYLPCEERCPFALPMPDCETLSGASTSPGCFVTLAICCAQRRASSHFPSAA